MFVCWSKIDLSFIIAMGYPFDELFDVELVVVQHMLIHVLLHHVLDYSALSGADPIVHITQPYHRIKVLQILDLSRDFLA